MCLLLTLPHRSFSVRRVKRAERDRVTRSVSPEGTGGGPDQHSCPPAATGTHFTSDPLYLSVDRNPSTSPLDLKWKNLCEAPACSHCAKMRGRIRLGKFQMILNSVGTIRISGQPSGNSGRERKRYRQLRLHTRQNETFLSTSRKITVSAAACTSGDTPSITHESGWISSRINRAFSS